MTDAVIISFNSTAILETFKKRLILIFSSLGIKPVIIGGVLDSEFFQSHSESVYGTSYKSSNGIKGLLGYIGYQIYISLLLLTLKKEKYYFHLSQAMLLPIAVIKIKKLFDKKVSLNLLPGGLAYIYYSKRKSRWTSTVRLMEEISFVLADRIVLYSPGIIADWNLAKYEKKIVFAYDHFLDIQKFKIHKHFSEREHYIGYIGRLSEEKGVVEFVSSLPRILSYNENTKILICGEGTLGSYVANKIKDFNLDYNDRIKFVGWVNHDDLPDYFNKIKILVLPSYSEGLPNIMLEAMACGTPVLATPVGAIPDVIIDGKNGFLMKNNSPECISENVNRALNSPELDMISEKGKHLIEVNYTFEHVVAQWKKIIL